MKLYSKCAVFFILLFFPFIVQNINAEVNQKVIELVLDASGSMNGRLQSGELKINAAKKAVSELAAKLPDSTWVALRAYGHQSPRQEHNCQDTQLLVNFDCVFKNRQHIVAKSQELTARGYTPITYVLTLSNADFPTVLEPGKLKVEHASLRGHKVVEWETGIEHGSVSNSCKIITLMPGQYEVMFGPLGWFVEIKAGKTTVLNPGTVTVKHASYKGHKIYDSNGKMIDSVSNTKNWVPLVPGDYSIEVNGKIIPFSIKEGEDITFEAK